MEKKSKRNFTNYTRFYQVKRETAQDVSFAKWLSRTVVSGVIFSILLFILVNFYLFSSIVSLDSFLFIFLILTVLTDGVFLLIQLAGRPPKPLQYKVDPKKVSAVIACYNGEAVIGETISHLLRQLPAKNIIVVSDASTDNTVKVAKSYGVRVVQNKKNMHKAFSVSIGVHNVKTPYVLLLDDDVLIGNTTIPTNLMDEGYTAVAFDVMPTTTDTFVNVLQRFEYRNSMQIGKNLRAASNAIGNISGAIGLYRTVDLQEQAYLHSGQFAGEDEQRTLLAHMYGEGKGIAFSNETVHTHVPNTFHALYRQRAYSWNLSVPELLVLYIRILFSPRYHYLLKAEKAYYIYIYLTDPLRLLFLWTLLLRPKYLFITYGVYLVMNTAVWLRTGRKDQYLAVLVSPVYTLWLSLCRFIGNFYWLKVKVDYLRKRHYRFVERRRTVMEYLIIFSIFTVTWAVSGHHFINDLRLFNKIRSSRLEEQVVSFQYDSAPYEKVEQLTNMSLSYAAAMPAAGTYTGVPVEKGDTLRAIAHKSVEQHLTAHPELNVRYADRAAIDKKMATAIQDSRVYFNGATAMLLIDNSAIEGVFIK